MSKKSTSILIIFALFLGIFIADALPVRTRFASAPKRVRAQTLGSRYIWTDSLSITTTAKDCTFTTVWEQLLFYPVGADALIRYGTDIDTVSWNKHKWLRVDDGFSINIGPGTKVRRLEFKTVTGTGAAFLSGYKTKRQF